MGKDTKLEVINKLNKAIKSFNEDITKLINELKSIEKSNNKNDFENKQKELIDRMTTKSVFHSILEQNLKTFKPKLGSSKSYLSLKKFKEIYGNIYLKAALCECARKPHIGVVEPSFKELSSLKLEGSLVAVLKDNFEKLIELLSDTELPKLLTT